MIIDCVPDSRIGLRLGDLDIIFFPKKYCSISVFDKHADDELSFIVTFNSKRFESITSGKNPENCSGLPDGR